jgi:hypothetical protein
MKTSIIGQEVTLTQAVAECYAFSPRKKTGAVICFEITFPDGTRSLKFGKNWHRVLKKWQYFEKMPGLPAFACEEAHFIPNIVSSAGIPLVYSAQQGKQKIVRIE